MKSLSERAICAIERRLRSIRTDDGFNTDAGLNVFRARRKIEVGELPAASVWEVGEQPNGDNGASGGGCMQIVLQVDIDCIALADQCDTGEVIGKIKADVKRAVCGASANGSLKDDNGTIGALRYSGAKPFPREDGSKTEAITIQLQVLYQEQYGDPYSGAVKRPQL